MAATTSDNSQLDGTHSGNGPSEKPSTGSVLRQGILGLVAGVIINAVLFYTGRALGGFPPTFELASVEQPITVLSVIVLTLIGGVAGTIFYWVLSRFCGRDLSNRIFLIVASIVLIVMVVTPFSIDSAPLFMVLFLELMHVGIGLPMMYFLIRA